MECKNEIRVKKKRKKIDLSDDKTSVDGLDYCDRLKHTRSLSKK